MLDKGTICKILLLNTKRVFQDSILYMFCNISSVKGNNGFLCDLEVALAIFYIILELYHA